MQLDLVDMALLSEGALQASELREDSTEKANPP